MDKTELSIIIVNWKVKDLLENCLASIFNYKEGYNLEVFVVDNNSADGSIEMIKNIYPQVKLIALPKNIGFGAANNLAIGQAKADNIFLLNPDTEITKDFFQNIFHYIKNHPELGIIGPKILNTDGSNQLSIRRLPDLLSQILVLLKLINVFPNNRILKRYLFKDFDYTKEQPVSQIMGAAMLIKKSVFNKIGTFDEKFFIWFEEVDLCQRASRAGIEIRYFPGASIIHSGGESFSKNTILRKQIIFDKSLLYYFYKHQALWQTLIILLFIPINIILTSFYVIFLKSKTS